jgi:hypothetical protein
LLPQEFLHKAETDAGVNGNSRVYSTSVVLWLLIVQRLYAGASLGTAVLELLRGLPASFWPRPCKRIRDWFEHGKIPSSHTGAYNQARQALPQSLVEQSYDHMFEGLTQSLDLPASDAFLLDGTTVRMAHSPALHQLYPPGSNQHGEAHWPLVRMLVAHDLRTGLAMRPEWGAMHGAEAVSEQALLERAMDRLPRSSTVMGDANFGVFSVADGADQRGHPLVVRLTADRARRLAAGPLRHGISRTVVWTPSRDDRRNHPELPAEACVKGRLIVRQVQPNNGAAAFLLAVFTTLSGPWQKVFALYGQRWEIETDLRTLKSTLRLDQLTCTSPDMVAKEIVMGMAAYNLVRAVIAVASAQSGIPPRGYSFTKVRAIVEILGPALANAPNRKAAQRLFDQMMQCIQQAKLPNRKRKRPSYPRQVWPRGAKFPARKE